MHLFIYISLYVHTSMLLNLEEKETATRSLNVIILIKNAI
jgi:hypothetical protein